MISYSKSNRYMIINHKIINSTKSLVRSQLICSKAGLGLKQPFKAVVLGKT